MTEPCTTHYQGREATWFVDNGVIRVRRIQYLDGHVEDSPTAPSLGECFDVMPRSLWEQVRYEFERDRVRDAAARSVEGTY